MKKSIHIAHVFPNNAWGGAEMYAVSLAESQQRGGFKSSLWTLGGSRMAEEAQSRGIPLLTEPVPYRLNPLRIRALAKVIHEKKITHLHTHWSGGLWAFLGIKALCRVGLVYHVHLWMKHSKKDPLHWALYSQADRLIVAGGRARRAVLECLPVRSEKLVDCPYAIDFKRFEALGSKRSDWGFGVDDVVLGLFARIDRQKGTKEFLEAVEGLLSRHPKLKILLVGDKTHGEEQAEEYAHEVQALMDHQVFRGKLHVHPFRKDYLELLRSCDVLVAPSYHESYSLVFLDAFALGIPVLTTDAGGSPDLVGEDRGWLVKPRDAGALRGMLEEVLSSPDEIRRKGRLAKEYVYNHHTFDAVNRVLEGIYNE